MASQKLRPFLNAGLLGITFSSNSSTDYALAGKDLIRDFLEGNAPIAKILVDQKPELPDDLFAGIIGYDDVKDQLRVCLLAAQQSNRLWINRTRRE